MAGHAVVSRMELTRETRRVLVTGGCGFIGSHIVDLLVASDIEVVVLTHLHFDHASAISEFPESTFIVSELEWEAATSARIPMLQGCHPPQYDHAVDYRSGDFGADYVGSYGPFGRTMGLFGDGSVHFLNESVDIRVYARMVTRKGGEVATAIE